MNDKLWHIIINLYVAIFEFYAASWNQFMKKKTYIYNCFIRFELLNFDYDASFQLIDGGLFVWIYAYCHLYFDIYSLASAHF